MKFTKNSLVGDWPRDREKNACSRRKTMKLPPRFSLLLLLCLLLVPALTVSAQQPSAGQTEVLRLKIADIESQELKGKSAIVQDLYKQMLAGLYKEYAA